MNYIRWTLDPVIVITRDDSDYSGVLMYSSHAIIAGCRAPSQELQGTCLCPSLIVLCQEPII